MIEIGRSKIVAVRTRARDGKLKPAFNADNTPKTKVISDQIFRVTRNVLKGRFGCDKDRKLVIGLEAGDLLTLRPQGTRQQVAVELIKVYEWVLQCRAMSAHMNRMRERKAAKQQVRAERRWKHELRKAVQ